MESTDSSSGSQQPNLPPGFRFHPTDEELVVHYLKKKASSSPLPVSIIAEVDLYKFDPWELPAKATFGEQEWYFFSPRDRKYPNGVRPNRAATSGYWKATGTDKPVLTSGGTQKVGVKKALVFYGGKPPKGIKTNWIMHEYRLADNKVSNKPPGYDLVNKKNSLRLDDWVLCRIYKKNNSHRSLMDHDKDDSLDDMLGPVSLPPSLSVGIRHNPNLFEQNLFDLMNNETNSISQFASSSCSRPGPAELSMLPLKRTIPSLYWTGEAEAAVNSSPTKKYQADNGGLSVDGTGSMVSLLSQMPEMQPLHPQTMLGSIGDGTFRPPYQVSGMNWYS